MGAATSLSLSLSDTWRGCPSLQRSRVAAVGLWCPLSRSPLSPAVALFSLFVSNLAKKKPASAGCGGNIQFIRQLRLTERVAEICCHVSSPRHIRIGIPPVLRSPSRQMDSQDNLLPTVEDGAHSCNQSNKRIQSVVIIFAMLPEAAPLIDHFGLRLVEKNGFMPGSPFQLYSGSLDGVKVHVLLNGTDRQTGVDLVGTVPAAIATYAAIQTLSPDIIINAGTAGGFKARGACIGDVYCGTAFVNHDRHIPIPGYDVAGIGFLRALETPNLVKHLGLKTGVVSTGNSLTHTHEHMEMMKKHNAVVKEMEVAAIAWVADRFSVPVIAIKAVTDIVDDNRLPEEEFLENLAAAARALQRTVPEVVRFVVGKTVNEL